jgi:Protein of unknown function (DUF3999)
MKKKWINLLLFGLITICCTAQTGGYKFYSKLDSVTTSGFYNIELTPDLYAHLKTDYSDLRIVNDAGKWIPHVLHVPANEKTDMALIMPLKFSIIENSGINTVLLIEGVQKISNNIGLVITNTAAERFCTLSGSNDKKSWFVINDSVLLSPVPAENETENILRINFPATSYRFYKVIIRNKNKDPFNIRGVVEYATASKVTNRLNKLIDNPVGTIQQKDSGKISYIKISLQLPYQFDNISLQLTGVEYYTRKVDLYIPYNENHSFSNPGQLLQSFTVSNNSSLQFKIPLTKASVYYLLINNEDNLPLTVNEVKTAISNHYITAYLENGNNYTLIMDNEAAVMPDYDLAKLNSKIPDSILFLHVGKITAAEENKLVTTPAKNNKWILWASIAAALLILLFFTYKMFKEVEKRKTT